jgi:hypothetical protein
MIRSSSTKAAAGKSDGNEGNNTNSAGIRGAGGDGGGFAFAEYQMLNEGRPQTAPSALQAQVLEQSGPPLFGGDVKLPKTASKLLHKAKLTYRDVMNPL